MLTVAVLQHACDPDRGTNLATFERLVREAAGQGARLICPIELFETPYFCIDQSSQHFELATPLAENPAVRLGSQLAAELGVAMPISFFERANNAYFNSIAMLDADGSILGCYRKTHIPNGPGYQEKQFFNPGDTGFKVWDTRYGRVGVGICWDQWFPETARSMALMGAEILLYPTAIGSEPQDAGLDSRGHWRRTMQGHAAANLMPVLAANRIGREHSRHIDGLHLDFYGNSFICDETGALLATADVPEESILTATFDLAAIARRRAAWGLFRDRRPACYRILATTDGGCLDERSRIPG